MFLMLIIGVLTGYVLVGLGTHTCHALISYVPCIHIYYPLFLSLKLGYFCLSDYKESCEERDFSQACLLTFLTFPQHRFQS